MFDRVLVTPTITGSTLVTFHVDTQRFTEPGPWNFYLEWAENPHANFIQVAGPTTGSMLEDTEQRRFSKLPISVYRIRLEDANGVAHYSQPNLLGGDLNRHMWLLSKDIVRREFLRLQRFAGTPGKYLARKHWGELCSNCLDHNTEMVTNENCTECYGTAFQGTKGQATALAV